MINPLRAVYLNNQWFNYVSDSYRESISLRNASEETQGGRAFSTQGKSKKSFTISLAMENTYNIYLGVTTVGSTTWLGVSRLSNFESIIGGTGASLPLVFVNPYGATYSVVPTGSIDIAVFNPSNPRQASMEFRVSLTLDES